MNPTVDTELFFDAIAAWRASLTFGEAMAYTRSRIEYQRINGAGRHGCGGMSSCFSCEVEWKTSHGNTA